MIEYFLSAVSVAADTAAYLMAWWGVPGWALAGAVVLQRLSRDWPLERWARSGETSRRLAGAFLLAVVRPFGRSDVRRNLEGLDDQPGATATYLTAGHGLTLYYFVLLGPLLGKDVLLAHVMGMVVFAGLAAALFRSQRLGGERTVVGANPGSSDPSTAAVDDSGHSGLFLIIDEGGRFLGWSLWGLVVGGLIGAAGLASPSLLLTDLLPGQGLARQIVHASVGLLAAPLTFMWPVATLFAGTFLWKIGLAQAGLVAFFCAATLSPQRLRLYREVWGTKRTARRAVALAMAAVMAGLFVALLFGAAGLEIHYKLTPEQLWRP